MAARRAWDWRWCRLWRSCWLAFWSGGPGFPCRSAADISNHGGLGLAFNSDGGKAGVGLALLQLVAFLLAGVLVRARRQAVSLAARSAALQRQAEQATAAERARIARELHDIIA